MLAVVFGDGTDEFVAAHSIERAGHHVTLVRRSDHARDEDSEWGWVPPQVVRDLDLPAHGFVSPAAGSWARAPLDGGGTLDLSADVDATAQAIGRLSPADAKRWPEFCARMHAIAALLAEIYAAPPPDPLATDLADLLDAARAGLRLRKLGRRGMEDLLRLMPMSIADLLDDWFESDVLKGVLAATGVRNLSQGPRSGGTAFNFLHHHVGAEEGVFVPPSSNAHEVLRALPGLHRREGTVTRIAVRDGQVVGVVLASGEILAADCVVSGLDPRRTLLELCDPGLFDPQLVRALRHVRGRGVAARLAFELASGPEWSRLVLAPSLDQLERAYDDVKYGRMSGEPLIEARVVATGSHPAWRPGDSSYSSSRREAGIPGLEHSRAGQATLEVHVQYAPYALDERSDDRVRPLLEARVREALGPHVSGMADAPLVSAMTPRDLEGELGFPQGQPSHAEIALDQALWMRPLPALAQYRTPLEGLYLCGPAMHPGGPHAGAAGANAASIVLRDMKRRKRK
jgi:phytoene dehydrogenase-like protein